ncbi:CBL-interacting serine threonine-protein kinase 1-like [Orobanche gracilis]
MNKEVLASKTKIYMVLEYVNGGELFERIASKGKLREAQKTLSTFRPENVLIDASGMIKITDFGLSALPHHFKDDGLLHTTCGSPNYVALEILSNRGYDGAASDTWSCGVILYVILTGYLPFDDHNLVVLYRSFKGDAQVPKWISSGAKNIIKRILYPNPRTRITMGEIKEDDWFKQDYIPILDYNMEYDDEGEENASTDDEVSSIHDTDDISERKIRFTSNHSPKELLERIENIIIRLGFHVQKKNGKLKAMQVQLERIGQKCLSATAVVFEISPSLYVVELRKAYSDATMYRQETIMDSGFNLDWSKKTHIFHLKVWVLVTIFLGIFVVLVFFMLWCYIALKKSKKKPARLIPNMMTREIKEIGIDQSPTTRVHNNYMYHLNNNEKDSDKLLIHMGHNAADSDSLVYLDDSPIEFGENKACLVVNQPSSSYTTHPTSPLSGCTELSHLDWGHWFTLRDLEIATDKFSTGNVIGEGGYGIVYRGQLVNGTIVAVKRLLNNLGQAEKEFRVEVEAIGHVRHKNLVRLLGYCIEGTHRLLVYEYVNNGNLEQWLHGGMSHLGHLTWDGRMKILLGTAKA